MNAETLLDYAQFQLSPRGTRCKLFVSGDGSTEKLASGSLKPFLSHLKVAEEQASGGAQLIKLEVEGRKDAAAWFNKGTLERFVRFVSTPEVLESVNTFDAEISQLEGARKIYSQGAGEQLSGRHGDAEIAAAAAADVTKKELVRAIDVRLITLKQDVVTSFARASAAGFNLETVSELLRFADHFGALRLKEACTKFVSVCHQRPELSCHLQSLPQQLKGFDDSNIRSSDSDMSIDEPEMDSGVFSEASNIGNPSRGQLLQQSTSESKSSTQVFPEKASKDGDEPAPVVPSDKPVQPDGKLSRRLSVQERISMFESKQKEQVASSSVNTSSSGVSGINKAIAGKGEHRRLPSSDISMEKSVLRRWSGASDMSIDLNTSSSVGDKKESGSVAGTPNSTVNSHIPSSHQSEEEIGLKDTATSRPQMITQGSSTSISSSLSVSQEQIKTFPKDAVPFDDIMMGDVSTTRKAPSEPNLEEKGYFQTQFDSSTGRSLQDALIPPPMRQFIPKDAKIPPGTVSETFVEGEYKDQAGEINVEMKSQAAKFRNFAGKSDRGGKAKGPLDSKSQSKTALGKAEVSTPKNDVSSEAQRKTSSGNQVEARRKERVDSSQVPPTISSVGVDGKEFGSQLDSNSDATDQIRKVQVRRDERITNQGVKVSAVSGKKSRQGMQAIQPPAASSVEQGQVARPSKGNQELNDELQIKANELEKLFAAHKLRVHGDQMASSRRTKPLDGHVVMSADEVPQSPPNQTLEQSLPRDSFSNGVEVDNLSKMIDNLDCAKDMKQKIDDINTSDDSRGILYEKYNQKRDEKLRNDWGTKKMQKEAKMKAMHDSLVRSQAEMKAKFAGFSDKQNSGFSQHRAERMKRSGTKNKGQQNLENFHVEGEEHILRFEQNLYGQDRSHSESGNESSTSSKKLVSSKSLSSSTQRTSANLIPRPSSKATNSTPVHRRAQPENPLAQSVPNFSDFRKENTKPLIGLSKVAASGQSRTYSRSKSTIEEAHLVKDDKSQRSQSMRKSSNNSGELKNIAPLNSYTSNQSPLRFQKKYIDQGVGKSLKSGELKSSFMKGNSRVQGAGSATSKFKASVNHEADDDLVNQQEYSPYMVKDEEEEFDRTSAEGNLQATNFPVDVDSEDDVPGSRNSDVLRSLSHFRDEFTAVHSEYIPTLGNMHESPEESPISWKGDTHQSFSYAQEASDIDASVESPTGSPTSWNSFPLNQMMEADAVRMRKKWGSAQIPVLAANTSHQSSKDLTKGFKRLLKFGRKSRGVDYLVNDWVSASTASEGDDDAEDIRELGNRSSEELRKSRMGYPTPVYDGLTEGDAFPEQVQSLGRSIPNAPSNFKMREEHLSGSSLKAPRSFFSLSSFRSKGSDPKPR